MSFFLITGLPRSRTAWLANYFTFGRSECWHDELLHGPEVLVQRMAEWALTNPLGHDLGHSDPANVFYWKQLNDLLERPKWVIVWRKPEEVIQSCRRFLPKNAESQIPGLITRFNKLIADKKVTYKIINYNALNESLQEIEMYLGLDWFCPQSRREMLCRFNIQIEAQTLKREINQVIKKGIPWESVSEQE